MPAPGRTSLWHATASPATWPPLPGDTTTDVVVVGAGITGLTAAVLLAEAGARVTVLEARAVGAGATGGTTGKVTSQHGLRYARLLQEHGEEVARAYATLNEEAIGLVRSLCDRYAADAAFETVDAFVYTEQPAQLDRMHAEVAAAQQLGLPASWTDTTALPYPTLGAVRFSGQGQMHAVRYLDGLAHAVDAADGGAVHERTRVTDISDTSGRVTVTTDRGQVTADQVVLATLIPIVDRGFEFARATAQRTYGIAALADDDVPAGMYITAEQPSRSIRHHREGDDVYTIVVGQGHETGHGPASDDHDAPLVAFARDRLARPDVRHRWSAQDFSPVDLLPFIGRAPFSARIHVAAGFAKWGLTNGTGAARILSRLIGGHDVPEAAIFAPTRTDVRAGIRELIRHNADAAARLVADRFRPDATSVDEIPVGGGGVVRVDGELMAVSRDATGAVTMRSAVCRHLGCVVQWNSVERSFDCPCHGSRYDVDGTVLDGPASRPLHRPTAPG